MRRAERTIADHRDRLQPHVLMEDQIGARIGVLEDTKRLLNLVVNVRLADLALGALPLGRREERVE